MKKITLGNWDAVFTSKMQNRDTAELLGYECIDELFVDSSGFGVESEPALTVSSFETKVKNLLKEHGTLYTCITEAGMFQVYVGFFTKTGKKVAKRVKNNTLRIETETGYKIRLHNTDIIEYQNEDIILNSGGWQTRTTKERLNEYLPYGMYISQKNYEWTVHDTNTNQSVPFNDGMRIVGGKIISL